MDDFYAARSSSMPPLPWTSFSPPFSFDADRRFASGVTESIFGAVYGAADWGPVGLRLGLSYTGHDIDTTRTVAFLGFSDSLSGSYSGTTAQAFGEIGYRLHWNDAEIEPFLGGSVTRLHTGRFVEDGGAAALIGASRTYEVGATTLGIRGQARLANSPFIVKGLLGWQHAFGDVEPHALMAFRDGTAAFSVTGAPIDRNALVAEAGLDWQATGDVSLSVSYRGQIGTHVQSHGLTGSFVLQF